MNRLHGIPRQLHGSRRALLVWLSPCLLAGFLGLAPPADARGPAWTISSAPSPTNFVAGDETGDDTYVLTVVDTGDGSAPSSPIEVTDSLPSGLVASSISGEDLGNGEPLSCSLTPTLTCSYEGVEVTTGDVLQIVIAVKVSSGIASSVVNSATVTGGGAEGGATIDDPTTISTTQAGFGISNFATTWSGAQAGASVNLTTAFTLNQVVSGGETVPAADLKEVTLNLPPGYVVNLDAVAQCSVSDALADACPAGAAVGVVFMSMSSGVGGAPKPYSGRVYNSVPSPGEPGALVLMTPSGPLRLGLTLRSDGNYGLRVEANAIPQFDALISMTLTLWGIPEVHNGSALPVARFLRSAGTCGALPDSTLSADSWTAPGVFVEASSATPTLAGCDELSFDPSLAVYPEVHEADEPSGYQVDLDLAQPEDPNGLASADLEEMALTLPEGAGISLSAANGLQACTLAQAGLGSLAPSTCPEASRVGEVELSTPLLASPLEGSVFLASPNANPFDSAFAVYLEAEGDGVLIKLAGQLELDPVTGQLTIVLRELPQIPLSRLDLRFRSGPRALLSTPATCGVATSTGELTPWSGEAGVTASITFEVAGANGTPCPASLPFSPVFQAGSTATGEVDVYGSLTLLVTRADQEEQLGAITIQAPSPVAQMFAGVPPCGEPRASEGGCPAASQIGTVAAQAGLGPDAVSLNGDVYLTGPYGGAPQGLSIVLPVAPFPFDLGTAVIRASAQIDPSTGRLSIASDRLPSVVEGVPLQLKSLALQLNHGEFRIDPAGCESLTVAGTLTSTGGSSITVSTDPLGASSSSCPPQQAAHTEVRVAPPIAGSVSLVGQRITTTKNGQADFKLTCSGASICRGKLTLTIKTKRHGRKTRSKTTTIGVAVFSIPPGKTTLVELRLNAAGRAAFKADHRGLSATLTVLKSFPIPLQTHTESVQLVQRHVTRPRRP